MGDGVTTAEEGEGDTGEPLVPGGLGVGTGEAAAEP